ncbi:MAG: 50S ribosomal protein L31e [Candidatus Aenigmarchaeota archaeon]|nr:50S ribosomal protein L31e [Candidatus Aenigmarchaeota archaeon]
MDKQAKASEMVYTIPLRKAFDKSRGKRVPYAVKIIQNYIQMHTKAETVKIGSHLNEKLWERSIQNPPRNVRVKVVRDGETAKVELLEFEYKEFKAEKKKESKNLRERLMGRLGGKAAQKEALEKMIEGKPVEEAKAEKKEEVVA